MKIAIITWISYKNYGTFLQAYSLQERLKEHGTEPQIVSDDVILRQKNRKPSPNFAPSAKANQRKLSCKLLNPKRLIRAVIRRYRRWKQEKKELPFYLSQTRYDEFKTSYLSIYYGARQETLDLLNTEFDLFVCGSDQIWNVFDVNFFGYYYLDFVKKPKFSYATSIGTTEISAEKSTQIKDWLKNYSFISVREKQTATQLQSITGQNVTWVVDPCLLHDGNWWMNQIRDVTLRVPTKYIVCYFLNDKPWYYQYAKEFAKHYHLKMVIIPSRKEHTKYKECYRHAVGPLEFVSLFQRAAFTLTDSFHGLVFSLLFNKDFLYYKRFQDDDPICQNIRITSLLGELDLLDRIIEEKPFETKDVKKLDFERIQENISKLRCASEEYIANALRELT